MPLADVIEQAISSGRGETDLRPHAAAETAYEVFTCAASGDDEPTDEQSKLYRFSPVSSAGLSCVIPSWKESRRYVVFFRLDARQHVKQRETSGPFQSKIWRESLCVWLKLCGQNSNYAGNRRKTRLIRYKRFVQGTG